MKKLILLFVVVVFASTSSCACFWATYFPSDARMQALGDDLRRLSAAVQGKVVEDPAGTAGLSDQELLTRATAHDPALLKPFECYSVRTSREGNYISLLVCTANGKRGLLEDTNCTVPLDKQLWHDSPGAPCRFTVPLDDACKVK